jgi:hypothetical protein
VSGKIFILVQSTPGEDLIRAAEDILADIRAGRTIGLAWIAMHKTYDYSVDIAGETKRSPTLTRGMLHLLDDELSQIIKKGKL